MAGSRPVTGLMRCWQRPMLAQPRLLMSVINAAEVFYFLWKKHSQTLAESWRESAPTLPVTIEIPTAEDIWSAATLKARFPIAYADAFAAALALKHKCPLVTGDPELKRDVGLELDWIGRGSRPSA